MAKEQQKDVIHRFNNVSYIFHKVHGYFAAQGVTEAIVGATGTYAHVSNATRDLFSNIQSNAGIDLVDDTFVFNPDDYPADSIAHMTFDFHIYGSGGANKNFEARMYNVTQAVEVPVTAFINSEGGGNYTHMNSRAYCMNCEVGDVYRLEIRPLDGNDTFTISNVSVWVELNHWKKI